MVGIVNATIWSSIQRFGSLTISFVSNMVLARLLCPEDFGTVAMIMVFVGLADVLVDGGLGNALIQSKKVSRNDIATVFSTNLIISLSLFITFFLFAPAIASYVRIENFDNYLRIESIMILIRAFYVVNFSLANRKLKFKTLAWIGLTSNFIATIIAIVLAYCGMGIWSLILKNIIYDMSSCFLFYLQEKAPLLLYVSKSSFKRLFSFGFFVAASNTLEMLYSNILSFVIGNRFSVKELGYYNQAYSLEQIPVYSMTSVLNQVMFPYMAKMQDEKDSIKENIRKSTMCISFFMFPLMVFLMCFAKPIIIVLYSEKWVPSVPYFQILCIIGFFNALFHLNRSVLKAIGKTKQLFYSQVFSILLGFLLIILALRYGIFYVVGVVAFNQVLSYVIVSIMSGSRIGYSILTQIKDTLMNFMVAVISGVISIYISSHFHWHAFILVIVMLMIYFIFYLSIHVVLRSMSSRIVFTIVK